MEDILCVNWASNFLVSAGYAITCEPKIIQHAPWATVWRFETNSGFIFLKKAIPEFFIEATIIEFISDMGHDFVPKVISVNHDLNCFLMLDAGVTLRERFKHRFDSAILADVIKKYTLLQCDIAEKSDMLIEDGVPDWRLKKYPDLYQHLIENDSLLDEIEISSLEKSQLYALKPRLVDICERLSSFNIPESLDHCDFHDNNVLYDEKNHRLTLIDLGEVVIAHPFFPLHSLFFMEKHWNYFKMGDMDYLKIKDACFYNFRQFESEQHLNEIFDLTLLLHPLFYVFSLIRLISACDKEGGKTEFTGPDGVVKSLQAQKNNIAGCLRQIIENAY